MSIFTSSEVGSAINQAGQRGIRNGWIASFIHVILAFAWGGFYHPKWINGSMIDGAIFAALALTVPLTMAVVGIFSYHRHLKYLKKNSTLDFAD
ncbi:MAG: hypothetical protein R3261_13310 [Alphaproteobacteria bacterium]|nr:hypothetical protein [Alphaproteobacteria bacterium]